jgi:hypothetical protein
VESSDSLEQDALPDECHYQTEEQTSNEADETNLGAPARADQGEIIHFRKSSLGMLVVLARACA